MVKRVKFTFQGAAPFAGTGVNIISLTPGRSATSPRPAGAHPCAAPNRIFQEKPPQDSPRPATRDTSRGHGGRADPPRGPPGAGTVPDGHGDAPTAPGGQQAGGGPPPSRNLSTPLGLPPGRRRPVAAGEAAARRVAMTGTWPGVSPTRKPTHLPSTLTRASVSPPWSWARPPPSTWTWPSPGRARPSSPPGSRALAGWPGTHSPGRLRLRSWPRGSAHAQRLRPGRGTHCRTRVARGLRAVPRAGCGVQRAAAVAELFREAAEPVPGASAATAATALRPRQPERLPQLSGVVV